MKYVNMFFKRGLFKSNPRNNNNKGNCTYRGGSQNRYVYSNNHIKHVDLGFCSVQKRSVSVLRYDLNFK